MKDIMRLDLHKDERLEVEALIVHGLQVLHDLMEAKLSDDPHPLRFAATDNELLRTTMEMAIGREMELEVVRL